MSKGSERRQRIRAVFDEVVELAPREQEARLRSLVPDDDELRSEVGGLLAASRDAGDRFEQPPVLADELPETGDAAPSLVGRKLGPYRVTHRVGQGGMGAVYEAERVDGQVTQRVAIKSVWRGADSDVLTRRFRSERQILAGLRHPNIAQFLDAGATAEGMPYLVMEFVDGLPIDRHCDKHRLTLTQRFDLFLAACAAVQHAHRHLVIHRDLKPSNVMVTPDGQVKLLDFGVAKLLNDPRDEGTLTGAGLSPFTAAYAAPEQVTGDHVSTATDVYALGALLTVLLAGRAPLDVSQLTPGEVLTTIRDRPAQAPSELARAGSKDDVTQDGKRPSDDTLAGTRGFSDARQLARALSGELDAITLMALRKEPSRRYATVDALAEDIKRYLRRERVLARPDTLAYRVQSFVRRRRPLVAGVAIAVIALAIGTTVSLLNARESRRAAARSERVAAFLARLTTVDAPTVDPIARLGSRGTMAQLLDSMVKRVQGEFADDAGIRARLYASIGGNYVAQGRLREAEGVLDSAVALAQVAYGPRSDEFAAANLEMVRALTFRKSPAESERHVRLAFAALAGRERERPELYSLCVLSLAGIRSMTGSIREADSLGREVLRLEAARTSQPTTTRSGAVSLVANTTAWIRRDPRIVDSMYAHAVAIMDSLGASLSYERMTAVDGRINALTTLGRYDEAARLQGEALAAAETGYGHQSREAALFLARGAALEHVRGNMATATMLSDSAWRILEINSDVSAWIVVQVAAPRVDIAWQAGRVSQADSVATRALEWVSVQEVPSATIFAAFYAGVAALRAGDGERAERHLRQALAALPATGDLDSMVERVRPSLAEALAAQGHRREADSVRALIAPQPPAARCVPGGDWRGC